MFNFLNSGGEILLQLFAYFWVVVCVVVLLNCIYLQSLCPPSVTEPNRGKLSTSCLTSSI